MRKGSPNPEETGADCRICVGTRGPLCPEDSRWRCSGLCWRFVTGRFVDLKIMKERSVRGVRPVYTQMHTVALAQKHLKLSLALPLYFSEHRRDLCRECPLCAGHEHHFSRSVCRTEGSRKAIFPYLSNKVPIRLEC